MLPGTIAVLTAKYTGLQSSQAVLSLHRHKFTERGLHCALARAQVHSRAHLTVSRRDERKEPGRPAWQADADGPVLHDGHLLVELLAKFLAEHAKHLQIQHRKPRGKH